MRHHGLMPAYRVRVELDHITPAIWRELRVPVVARRLPIDRGDFPKVAGLLVMLDLAAQDIAPPPPGDNSRAWAAPQWRRDLQVLESAAHQRLSDAAWSVGWRTDTGDVPGQQVEYAADLTLTVLRRCGVVPAHGWSIRWQPTEPGLAFLRTALRA